MHIVYLFILGFLIPYSHKTAKIGVDGDLTCDDASYIPYMYSLGEIERLLNVSTPYTKVLRCSPSNVSSVIRRTQNTILFRMLMIRGKLIDLVRCKRRKCPTIRIAEM